MEMHIFSYDEAIRFVPKVPTYAIRIFSTAQEKRQELVLSENWIHIARYTFDEETKREYLAGLDEETGQSILPTTLFTPEIAREVIGEFIPFRDSCESMLVHCVGGCCRSKSVGRAMNQIFKLGNPLKTFFNPEGKMTCPHFYNIIIKEARVMQL
jgi:predicted protein tyrosine phosphatase